MPAPIKGRRDLVESLVDGFDGVATDALSKLDSSYVIAGHSHPAERMEPPREEHRYARPSAVWSGFGGTCEGGGGGVTTRAVPAADPRGPAGLLGDLGVAGGDLRGGPGPRPA